MTNNNYQDLEQRMLRYGAAVVRHVAKIKSPIMRPIVDQLVRSATSVGANYTEANNASSKLDFRNKVFISKKEASESRYWLQMLAELGDLSQERSKLEQETQELIMILQKIVNSLKDRPKS